MYHYFINEAVKEAKMSPIKYQYGALLVHRDKIISRGHNHMKNVDISSKKLDGYINNKYSIHAEQHAINQCSYKHLFPKCKLILVKLINSNDNCLKICCPCNLCDKILKRNKIKKICIYYHNMDTNKTFLEKNIYTFTKEKLKMYSQDDTNNVYIKNENDKISKFIFKLPTFYIIEYIEIS